MEEIWTYLDYNGKEGKRWLYWAKCEWARRKVIFPSGITAAPSSSFSLSNDRSSSYSHCCSIRCRRTGQSRRFHTQENLQQWFFLDLEYSGYVFTHHKLPFKNVSFFSKNVIEKIIKLEPFRYYLLSETHALHSRFLSISAGLRSWMAWIQHSSHPKSSSCRRETRQTR